MAMHNKDTFILPVSPGDDALQIRDINGNITWSIVPHSVTALYVDQNMIKLKSKSSNTIITIHFVSNSDAIIALSRLQLALSQLKSQVSSIPPDITEYINNVFNTLTIPELVYNQVTPSSIWNITHTIPKRPPIHVLNDNFEEIEGVIKFDSVNTIKIYFNTEVTGWVIG